MHIVFIKPIQSVQRALLVLTPEIVNILFKTRCFIDFSFQHLVKGAIKSNQHGKSNNSLRHDSLCLIIFTASSNLNFSRIDELRERNLPPPIFLPHHITNGLRWPLL